MWRKVLLLLSTGLLIITAAACPSDGTGGTATVTTTETVTPTPTETPDPIKIGSVMCITGALAGIGPQMRDAVILAVKTVNDAGGINGAEVVLTVEDSKTDSTGGFEAVKKLATIDGIDYIVGPMISGASLAAGPWAGQNNVLLISPSATSPDIADQDWRQFFFRTAPLDNLQGAAMAQLVKDGGYQRVAIIVVDNQYGVALGEVCKNELAGSAEIVAEVTYDLTKLDYLTELQIIRDQNPDAVIHVGYHDDARVLYKQALQLGMDTGVQWVAAEGVYSEYTLEEPEAAEFMARAVIGTRPTAPEGLEAYATFAAAYQAMFGIVPGVYCDTTYDATMLILTAIENVGADDPAAVATEVLRLADNYPGVSGSVTINEIGDRVSAVFEVWGVQEVGDQGGFTFERLDVVELS